MWFDVYIYPLEGKMLVESVMVVYGCAMGLQGGSEVCKK